MKLFFNCYKIIEISIKEYLLNIYNKYKTKLLLKKFCKKKKSIKILNLFKIIKFL